jgi:hypothetical protein
MSGWISSFTMAIGTGPTMAIGIGQRAITDHGVILKVAECPMWCAMYPLIFVTAHGSRNGFIMRTSRETGRRGSRTSTGTDTIIGMRHHVATMVGDGKTTTTDPIVDTRYETPVTTGDRKTIRAM